MISTIVILQKYYHFVAVESYNSQIDLIDNCKSGMNLLKYHPKDINNQKIILDLYQNQEDSVQLSKKEWGCFSIFCSEAFRREDTMRVISLMGSNMNQVSIYSLYLADCNRPLSLCGKTKIEGNAFLPESGVKRAYIEGRSYVGDHLIYGLINVSDSKLPRVKTKWLSQVENFISKEFPFETELIFLSEIRQKLKTDFTKTTKVIFSQDSISIDDLQIEGNVIVSSSKAILVKNNSNLENVILVAPKIYLENSVVFQGQLLANEAIFIDENCSLDFPSAIVTSGNIVKIEIKSGTIIQGSILTTGEAESSLSIEKDVIIVGEVFNNGSTQIKGKIIGSLTTNKFFLQTPSSIYENHLLGGEISSRGFPKEYFGLQWNDQQNNWVELVDLR